MPVEKYKVDIQHTQNKACKQVPEASREEIKEWQWEVQISQDINMADKREETRVSSKCMTMYPYHSSSLWILMAGEDLGEAACRLKY